MISEGILNKSESVIEDVGETSFMSSVIEKSKEVPVIVDFWAPWCAPCKQLTPILEEAVKNSQGKVRLAKINIDENQNIAAQLRVQSIPMVYAFVDGKPIDGFSGAVTNSEIINFVSKIANSSNQAQEQLNEIKMILERAEENLKIGNLDESITDFSHVMELSLPNDELARSISGLGKSFIAKGDIDDAKNILEGVQEDILNNPYIESLRASLGLLVNNTEGEDIDVLRKDLELDKTNKDKKYKLAQSLISSNQNKEAIDLLLQIIKEDSNWNNGEAKKKILELFKAIGDSDNLTIEARTKLATILFS